MYHGRDRDVWTPKFEGTRVERYTQAVNHFRGKMGLEGSITFSVRPAHPEFCAWLSYGTSEWGALSYGLVDPPSKGCKRAPEVLAFHEACHERYAHVGSALTSEEKHSEVRKCMKEYSRKDRR
jgi:hypothetical protein